MATVPAFADIGKAAKELLAGSRTSGVFQLDPKVAYSSVTNSGVNFTVTAVKKGEKLEPSLKVAYSTKKYSVDATLDTSSKIAVNGSLSEVAPGLKLSSSVSLPDPTSAKLGLDYSMPYLSLKSTVGLTSAPLVEIAASSGYKNFVVGGEAGYDTGKSAVSKYTLALGYHAPDFQVAATLADKADTAKLSYAHNISSKTTVGAEVTRKVAAGDTAFSLGYLRKLDNGALTKFKLDNTGLLSALYETKLASGEKVSGAFQIQTTDMSKPVKYGFALDLA